VSGQWSRTRAFSSASTCTRVLPLPRARRTTRTDTAALGGRAASPEVAAGRRHVRADPLSVTERPKAMSDSALLFILRPPESPPPDPAAIDLPRFHSRPSRRAARRWVTTTGDRRGPRCHDTLAPARALAERAQRSAEPGRPTARRILDRRSGSAADATSGGWERGDPLYVGVATADRAGHLLALFELPPCDHGCVTVRLGLSQQRDGLGPLVRDGRARSARGGMPLASRVRS
jgi:hypothetical protein